MVRRITRRIVPLIGVVALVLNLAVVPQRARAVAVTAAVAASAAAILTACGVSYWAATQTDAIDYIAGKIDDYLDSIDETGTTYEDWLEISGTSQLFEVVSGGVMRFTSGVANKLLDFCRWLQNEEGIESGGQAVVSGITRMENQPINVYGDTPTWTDIKETGFLIGYSLNDGNPYYGHGVASSLANTYACLVGQNTIVLASNSAGAAYYRYNFFSLSSSSITNMSLHYNETYDIYYDFTQMRFNYDYMIPTEIFVPQYSTMDEAYTALSTVLHDGNVVKNVEITPSEFVNIPAAIDSDAVFALKPAVDLTSGDSVDDASEAILDGITSEDGLSSTVEETPDTSWGWLYTLLSNIASTIGAGVSDIKDKLDGIKGSADDAAEAAQGASTAAQGAAAAAQDAATAAQGVQDAVEGMQSTAEGIEDNTATIARNLAPATYGNVADYQLDLTSLFPFCIPRDIYTAIGLLVAEPEAPSIDWDMPLPNGSTYHIEYDLSDWDGIASLLRHLELLLYGVGLMMATKSIIKW